MLSLFLSFFLVVTQTPLVALANEENVVNPTLGVELTQDVSIYTVEDFLDFANDCKIANYSERREVHLKSDLDISECIENGSFAGITSFSGTFFGENHVISGLNLSTGSESLGLFRYVEKGAVVRDLVVNGNLSCEDSKNNVGGIAGINAGTIRNCAFRGTINGVGITGGIVGLNGNSGSVIRCASNGTINSAHKVGGIVGENRGVITDCLNQAGVNSGTEWMEIDTGSSASLSVSSVFGTINEEIEDGTDFGGIAGYSDGIIAGCENKAIVGYPHSGKNVGGIVGRHAGQVIRCENYGRVYGKQDVGGIVGQFEPKTIYEDVDELDTRVDELHDMMNDMISHMESMGDDLHKDFQDINAESSAAGDTADALLDEMRDVIKKNVDVINELARRIDYAMNHFEVVVTYVNSALDTADLILDDMDRLRKDLDIQDQMENDAYDPAKQKRLALLAGEGGSLSSDNNNPAEGAKVTITVKCDPGYQLQKLTLTPYQGVEQDVTDKVSEDTFVIDSMPAQNQTVKAVFAYVGGNYVISSNAGGHAYLSSDRTTLKIEPADGYEVISVTLDGGDNLYSDSDSVTLPTVVTGKSGNVVVTFQKKEGAHSVKVVTGTGGTITADPILAMPGETVTLSITAMAGYELDADSVKIQDATGADIPFQAGLSYTFVMPACDVVAEGTFRYHPTEDTGVYAVSNVGGTVVTYTNPTTRNTNVVITCADGYQVNHLVVTDSAAGGPNTYTIPAEELSSNETTGVYTYDLAAGSLTNPVCIETVFEKKQGLYYRVNSVSGVGGSVLVDKASVTEQDSIKIVCANETHYYLEALYIAGGENLASMVEKNVYDYQVPDGISADIEIIASYQPVTVIPISDTVGGKANYYVSGREGTIQILSDTGYALQKFTLMREDGQEILCTKEYADSDLYRFDVTALDNQPAYLTMWFVLQNNKDTVDNAKDELENQTDQLVEEVNNISNTSDEIRDLLTDDFGNAKKAEDLTEDEIQELADLLLDLMEYVSDAGVASGGMLGNANTIFKVTGPYAEDALENANDDLEQLSADARAMNESMQSAGKELQGILDYLNSLPELRAVNFSDNFDKNSDTLKTQLDTINSLLNRLDNHAYRHSEILEKDMRAINDKMNEIFNLLVDKLDHIEGLANGEDFVEDKSAEDPESTNASRVFDCVNEGVVQGDRNVGGIAGAMGREIADNETSTKLKVGGRYLARAVLMGCNNSGFITVKNEKGGGIVGNLEIGYVTDSLGSGRIQSETGNYIGGIAGISCGIIDHCSSNAVLRGSKYVGGIAGQAEYIKECYSMVTILSADGFVGAVAGQDREDAKDQDDITIIRSNIKDRMEGNYYVSTKLYGINGVSYVGVAEPVSYQTLLTMENVPNAFWELTVTFLDTQENVVQASILPYGFELANLEYPSLKTDSGDYMEWEGFDGSTLEGNIVIQAVETSIVTVLSGEKNENQKAMVLASGTFTESSSVHIEEYAGKLPSNLAEGAKVHAYRVTMEKTGLEEDAVTKIRLLNIEQGTTTVYRLDQNKWRALNSKSMGSYEEVEMLGNEGVFCLVTEEEKTNWTAIGLAGGGGVVLALAAFVVVISKKKKRKK